MKHFSDAVAAYTHMNPTWKSSRRGVVEFVMRAHNSVNSRNHRKVYTFADSITELEKILPSALASTRRQEYLSYIRNDWMKNMTMEGISTAPKIRELMMIEENYWSKRTFEWYELSAFSDINVSPISNVSSSLTNSGGTLIPRLSMPQAGFKLKTFGRIGPLSNLRS
jgi:hypothetical protein